MWSGYLQQLSSVARLRYKEKVSKTGLKVDPYSIKNSEWEKSPELLPAISWSDVTVYMISTPSPYTGEALKAWKGMLDSEGFVTAGWVHDLLLHSFDVNNLRKFVIKAK
uniref:Uncharacterized protein n=1 Tax=Amphimedon queenslandica TaxID=400682 RepID=A0A1X7VNI4_AMPQE